MNAVIRNENPPHEATLHDYATAEELRPATYEEFAASIEAAKHDGGAGVITVEIDGDERSCYVMA